MHFYNTIFYILIICLTVSCSATKKNESYEKKAKERAQKNGIQFKENLTFEAAVKMATEQKKPIFVYAYGNECTSCEFVSRYVYTAPEVKNLYEQQFINVKLNMSDSKNTTFKGKHSILVLPTFLYFSPEKPNTPLVKQYGKKIIVDMMNMGKEALQKNGTPLPADTTQLKKQ